MKATKAVDRLLVTAMPKSKKEAEAKVVALSETLFEHVMKLYLFGDVQDTNKWLKEVRDKCFRMQGFASETTNGHLKASWVLEQIFTDYAKSVARCAGYATIITENNPEYSSRIDYVQDAIHVYTVLHSAFEWLSRLIVDKNFHFASPQFYAELKKTLDIR